MKIIDIGKWKRKVPYENFINYTDPVFNISTRLDVTELVLYCKNNNRSFFASFLYVVAKCVNQVDELKIRIKGDNVVLYDKVNPGYVVMNDKDTIVTAATEFTEDYETFYNNVRRDIEIAKKDNGVKKFSSTNDNDCFFTSCLPWLDINTVKNPYDLKNKEQSSIPRITWGKFVLENGRYKMGFDIACHHALTDGKPLCDVMNKISNFIKEDPLFK